jgi:hypothetical protein
VKGAVEVEGRLEGAAAVLQAVADTLRTVATWGCLTPEDLLGVAAAVESCNVASTGLDGLCCPICEEVECDCGCPLEPLRRAALVYTVRAPFRFPATPSLPGDPRCAQLGPEDARCQLAAAHAGDHRAAVRVAGNEWARVWASCDHTPGNDRLCARHDPPPPGVDDGAAGDAVRHALGRAMYECLAVAGDTDLGTLDAVVARAVEVAAPLLVAEGRRLERLERTAP